MTEEYEPRELRVALFAGLMFLIVLMSPVATVFFPPGSALYATVGTSLFFLTFGLIYVIVFLFIKWEGGSSISEVGADIEDSDLVPHLSIGLLAGAIGAGIVVLIASMLGGDLRPLSEITGDLILNEIIITVPTAFFEELAYRGYMMDRMTKLWGQGRGIIISSLIFALFHFGWWVPLGTIPLHLILIFTFNLTLGGIVLSYSYFWSNRKLWVPIGFHFTWNMLAYIMFPFYPREPVIQPEIFQIEWGITTIAGFLIGLSVIWLLIDQFVKKK